LIVVIFAVELSVYYSLVTCRADEIIGASSTTRFSCSTAGLQIFCEIVKFLECLGVLCEDVFGLETFFRRHGYTLSLAYAPVDWQGLARNDLSLNNPCAEA